MTAPETSALGWPDPARPGVPQNMEVDGWHWIEQRISGQSFRNCFKWEGLWRVRDGYQTATDFARDLTTIYLGPVVTPEQQATAQADAAAAETETAALKAALLAWLLPYAGWSPTELARRIDPATQARISRSFAALGHSNVVSLAAAAPEPGVSGRAE